MDLLKFREQIWMVLSDGEKRECLAQLEEERAKRQGRDPSKIEYRQMRDGYLGFYDDNKNRLIINPNNLLDAGKSVASVLHEGRHAYQHKVICDKKPHKHLLEWSQNWDGYLDPRQRGIEEFDYRLQPLEKDAWEYTHKELKGIAKSTKDKRLLMNTLQIGKTNELYLLLAQNMYGKKYQQFVEAKIAAAYSKTKENSYSSVAEQLGKEEQEESRAGGVAALDGTQAHGSKKVVDKKEAKIEVQDKDVKALAAKYGLAEDVVTKAFSNMAAQQQSKASASKESASEDSLTVKVLVKSDKGKGQDR